VRKEIIMEVKDPVCGMEIDSEKAFAKREHEGRTFYFDSQDCVDRFDANPHKYGHPEEHKHHEGNDVQS